MILIVMILQIMIENPCLTTTICTGPILPLSHDLEFRFTFGECGSCRRVKGIKLQIVGCIDEAD